ncbi:MAG: endonuclease III domain-containing protein [Candidatus Micrarchaeia archaeon]
MDSRLLEKDEAEKAIEILENTYRNAKYYLNFSNPIELLVAAILSAQTHDEVVNAVTPELFKRFKTVHDYASANTDEILKYVGKVSFAGNKVKNIISACKIIEEKHNGIVPREMDSLLELPGVGRKTANTILINAYNIIEGIPVDTWVIKLSYRIGFSLAKKPEDIEKDLMKIVEKKYWHNIAYVLKQHGHSVCNSQVPICSKCVISKICRRNGVKKSM